MKFTKKSIFAAAAAAMLMTVSACGGGGTKKENIFVTGPYFTGQAARSTYRAYLGSGITTLNYVKSQNAADSRHVGNFVDGLVMNDQYGILRRRLAEKVSHNPDYSEFKFQIRDDAWWYTSTGSVYKANGVKQEVIADDFVNSAEIILNYNNSSDLGYLVAMFLKNGYEYYCYTMMNYLMQQKGSMSWYPSGGKQPADGKCYDANKPAPNKNCIFNYSSLKNASDEQKAAQLTNLIAYESSKSESECVVTADMLEEIASFRRVGVKTGDNDHELVYTLSSGMTYFPTVLTYCPFLPVNRAFFQQYKMSGFGTSADKILYNGPYLCSKWDGSEVNYVKNDGYYYTRDTGFDEVHIKKVQYKVLPDGDLPNSFMRDKFDAGEIDGFSLTKSDKTGWEMYIGGADGSGTYQNPVGTTSSDGRHYADYVNSREIDTIDFLYSFNINMNRDPDHHNAASKDSLVTKEEIENANRALKIKEVRAMLLDGVDLNVYGDVFVDLSGAETVDQYAVNTIVPKGFSHDENDKDYVEYYFDEYAAQKGISVEEATNLLKQQQYSGINYEDSEYDRFVTELRDPAIEAINKYNEACDAGNVLLDDNGEYLTAEDKITFPVKFETLGSGSLSAEYLDYDNHFIENLNEKTNGCRLSIYSKKHYSDIDLPTCTNADADKGNYPYFQVIENSKITSSATHTTFSNGSYYSFGLVWGWGPDYADPLTYMNCYVENGDMTKYLGYTNGNYSYSVGDDGEIGYDFIARSYTEKVREAAAVANDTQVRYQKFAEAEYILHDEMKVIRPTYMSSQGWSASVSRAAGYENPTASYGLAEYRLTGMWVLEEVPTAAARVEARAYQATLKQAEIARVGLIDIYNA